jgi:hypothetical protein
LKEKVLWEKTYPGWCICVKWYQSEEISLFSVEEKKGGIHHAAEERKTITRSKG